VSKAGSIFHIHSLSTSLGTPVLLLNHAIIQSAINAEAMKYIKSSEQQNAQHIESGGGWATTPEDYVRSHLCQPRTGTWGCSGNRLTQTGQLKTRNMSPGLIISTSPEAAGGRVTIWCQRHESMDPTCFVVQAAAGGVMVHTSCHT